MCSSELKKLESILFGDGRQLLDIKFFPGEQPCTPEQLLDASAQMLELALRGKGTLGAPKNKKAPSNFLELV